MKQHILIKIFMLGYAQVLDKNKETSCNVIFKVEIIKLLMQIFVPIIYVHGFVIIPDRRTFFFPVTENLNFGDF